VKVKAKGEDKVNSIGKDNAKGKSKA